MQNLVKTTSSTSSAMSSPVISPSAAATRANRWSEIRRAIRLGPVSASRSNSPPPRPGASACVVRRPARPRPQSPPRRQSWRARFPTRRPRARHRTRLDDGVRRVQGVAGRVGFYVFTFLLRNRVRLVERQKQRPRRSESDSITVSENDVSKLNAASESSFHSRLASRSVPAKRSKPPARRQTARAFSNSFSKRVFLSSNVAVSSLSF